MSGPLLHGGQLGDAMRHYPDAPRPFIDLSTGINPHAYPMPPLDAADCTRLPEAAALADLEAAAARAYGIADPACVVAAAGTQPLIALLPRLRARASVAVVGPTYAEHEAAWRLGGHAVREVEAPTDEAEVLVVCSPNNPDGRVAAVATLADIATRVTVRGGWLVIDEAFIDLSGRESAARLISLRGVVVLRSFGKTYGLAGLRLGFALAHPDLARRLRASLGPWPVSGPAIVAGRAALRDDAWRAAARARLEVEAAGLRAVLTEAGLDIRGGALLFHLVEVADAASLHHHLCTHGILTRRFPAQPRWLRLGLPPDPPALARLRHALAVRPRNTWRAD
ncbi:threonine-phosphate decarboxylase CobD [Acidisphaera rubrifaciens]|uniref:threonine-phosphate decarboxylase n=1 Tax=Acidisphaera rubrifaciens HS-AP3 TaxID=1231350 RepID=A0A0D6P6J6_9PROT|nr:threonine-phosphate decarboxylase CobD [Acidisphaera rubrifaciens]GAN76818.1 L-threonine-O-3-phosphate decarboxylase [Acidisphaera rubrifaciens HS-AP3]